MGNDFAFSIRAQLAVVFLTTWTTSIVFGQPSPVAPRLDSMHGTMITLIDEKHGIEMEVWAKADKVRSEIKEGDKMIVVIQLGDTLYTFSPGRKEGQKTRFDGGLAAHGLIEQIALVKSKGKLDGTQEANGIAYDRYAYEVDAPGELAIVLFEAKTSLPKDWLSIVEKGDGKHEASRTIFRDMQANVEVPDSLFELPPEVQFEEITAGDLMRTAD
jgi:hypothetical protein